MHGLIILKILRKQFLGKVLKASRIESGDSVPDFDFSAHQSCTLLRFLWQSERPRVKAAPNCHGELDDMTYAALVRARLSIAKRSSSAARATPSHAPTGTNVIGFATAVTVNVFSEINKIRGVLTGVDTPRTQLSFLFRLRPPSAGRSAPLVPLNRSLV